MPQTGQLVSTEASTSLLQARSQQLLQQAKAHAGSDDPQIEKSAKAFESILLDKWLEEADHSFATVPGGDPDKEEEDPGADQFRNLALQSLAEKISESGGLGIAAMIVRQLGHRTSVPDAGNPADSKGVDPQGTKGELLPRNEIKVFTGKDR